MPRGSNGLLDCWITGYWITVYRVTPTPYLEPNTVGIRPEREVLDDGSWPRFRTSSCSDRGLRSGPFSAVLDRPVSLGERVWIVLLQRSAYCSRDFILKPVSSATTSHFQE